MAKRIYVGSLPYSTDENQLEELFKQFNSQLKDVFDTIRAYREVTDLINGKQPLANKKKYVRVRMRHGRKDD